MGSIRSEYPVAVVGQELKKHRFSAAGETKLRWMNFNYQNGAPGR
jgi:hypothetical protein